jgi:hypothetical protein
MTEDEVDDVVGIAKAFLSRRLPAADWRLRLRRRNEPHFVSKFDQRPPQ